MLRRWILGLIILGVPGILFLFWMSYFFRYDNADILVIGWSDDDQYVAFLASEAILFTDEWYLYVVKADGTHLQKYPQMPASVFYNYYAEWLPGKHTLSINLEHNNLRPETFLIDITNGTIKPGHYQVAGAEGYHFAPEGELSHIGKLRAVSSCPTLKCTGEKFLIYNTDSNTLQANITESDLHPVLFLDVLTTLLVLIQLAALGRGGLDLIRNLKHNITKEVHFESH